MNLEISSLMWGLTIGFAAGSLIVALLWHLIHKHRVREVLELGAIVRSNLENLFTDQPLRTIRRRRLRDADPIAVVIDDQLLILRDQNADTRRQVKQLRIVLESMTEGVVAVDSRLRVILANPAAQPLLGIEASSLGRLLPEVIRNPKLLQIASDSVDQCKAIEAQFPLSTRDSLGRTVTRLIAVRIAPILRSLEGERPVSKPMASGAVFVVQDVTELRRLEHASGFCHECIARVEDTFGIDQALLRKSFGLGTYRSGSQPRVCSADRGAGGSADQFGF